MNLNANEVDRRKCYNCEKKNHIMKRYKNLKLIQQLDTLKKDLDEKNRKHSWEKKVKTQILKENEYKTNFEKKLKYGRECVSFTTCIYRSLHSMTFIIDKKAKRIKNRLAFDQKNFMLKFMKTRYSLKAEQNMYYFKSEKNSEYIYKELKKYNETSNACESLKKFKNTSEIHEFYKKKNKDERHTKS